MYSRYIEYFDSLEMQQQFPETAEKNYCKLNVIKYIYHIFLSIITIVLIINLIYVRDTIAPLIFATYNVWHRLNDRT